MSQTGPTIREPIPELRAFAGSALPVLDLKRHLAVNGKPSFSLDGELPRGVELSEAGFIQGTPAADSADPEPYSLDVIVSDPSGETLTINLLIYVLDPLTADGSEEAGIWQLNDFSGEKAKVWRAMLDGIPLPSTEEMLNTKIFASDVDYLYRQLGSIMVLNSEGKAGEVGEIINLAGGSDEYNVYEFENALIGTPKELFKSRTLKHGIQTARAMVVYAHQKGWNAELGGYRSLVDAAWNHVQELNLQQQHQMQVSNWLDIMR